MARKSVDSLQINKTLDARSWSWPWNILKVQKQLKLMKSGDILELVLSGTQDHRELFTVIEQIGHQLVQIYQEHNDSHLFIKCIDSPEAWTE